MLPTMFSTYHYYQAIEAFFLCKTVKFLPNLDRGHPAACLCKTDRSPLAVSRYGVPQPLTGESRSPNRKPYWTVQETISGTIGINKKKIKIFTFLKWISQT